jgi:conjugal transfer mating pair stabilization protein TraN
LAKLDSAIMGMNKGGAIRGSWEALRQPVTSTWSAVTESFTSVANSLTGKTAEAATDAAAEGILAGAKQEVLSKTATWAAQTFGDAAVNVLFSTTNNSGAAVVNGVVQGQIQLGGGAAWLGSLMAWAMWAYTIYTVAMILIRIIWTCEKQEFELGAKRELKSCHHVGGYCKSKVLGWCIEKRDTYCCFNTPLARILNEQIRPQLGRGWGIPKNPDCKGINVQDFSRVDWSRVNLDEWLAILFETGHFPTAETINLENLTGTGSVLSGGNRGNSVERSVGRTTGLDAEQTRRDAEAELWSDALPNLP